MWKYCASLSWSHCVCCGVCAPVYGSSDALASFDAHFWCSKDSSDAPFGGDNLVLAWVNLGTEDLSLALPDPLSSVETVVYTLTNGPSGSTLEGLQSDTMYLNGEALSVNADGSLPVYPIPGKSFPAGSPLTAPALSYGFIAFAAPGNCSV